VLNTVPCAVHFGHMILYLVGNKASVGALIFLAIYNLLGA